jgi:hypothetical protein
VSSALHRRRPRTTLAGLLLLAAGAAGCASHAYDLAAVRAALVSGDVPAAVGEFEKVKADKKDLLNLLEKGYMTHLAERWDDSNGAFQRAEERAEELYTKSVTQEAAALLTSDLVLPYRGMSYELHMVQYYRALNYLALDEPEEALVEARKANAKLALYAEEAKDVQGPRQDAFMQYVTGLLYASEGEWNDAVVSLRDAARLYRKREEQTGAFAPGWLDEDYYEAATRVGLTSEVDSLEAMRPSLPARVFGTGAVGPDPAPSSAAENNLVVFFESGFVPFREAVDIVLPIYDDIDWEHPDAVGCAHRYRDEFGGNVYAYEEGRVELDHVLRFAFPRLVDVPSRVRSCELVLPGGAVVRAEPALDLGAVAHREFGERIPGILIKTVARAVVKEAARRTAKKEDEALGWLVNTLNVATEAADTRGWIFLPGRVDLAKARAPGGPCRATARFLDADGALVDEFALEFTAEPGRTTFVSLRTFQ